MDRRFLTVLGVSLLFALVISGIFYQMSARASAGAKNVVPDVKDVVIAARPLPVGITIKPDDIKLTKLPTSAFPKGAFARPEEVIDRPVVSNILLDEPILDGRLAARGSGLGLAPVIPVGMRAVSVRVNEVVGVAGFVLPGMHVDVLVTGRPPGDNSLTMTTTVLQDITVLSAGQTVQPDPRGQAINAPVVTLLVSPDHAEVLTLAGTEAKIQLVLRNASDTGLSSTRGRRLHELYKMRAGSGGTGSAEEGDSESEWQGRRPRPRPVAVAQTPPVVIQAPAPPPPVADQIVVIRGNQKTVEVVGSAVGNARVGRN